MKKSKIILINIKKKSLGEISRFIIQKIKQNYKNDKIFIKILLLNENLINFKKKKYIRKYYYHHTGYLGKGLKKKSYIKLYEKKKKELIKNSILGMIKTNIFKKIINKNIKFLNIKNLKNIKSKIIYF